jgi:hypothetical protein
MCACNRKSKPLQARQTSTAQAGATANPARVQVQKARPTSQPRGASPAPLKS